MTNVFQSLLLVIASATRNELTRQIKYLKVENEILRSKLPERITITPNERQRLVKFAQKLKLGKALHQLAMIVKPNTLLRWIRDEKKQHKIAPAKRGGRRTPEQIRRLILKLARKNEWGYTKPHPHYAPLEFAKQLLDLLGSGQFSGYGTSDQPRRVRRSSLSRKISALPAQSINRARRPGRFRPRTQPLLCQCIKLVRGISRVSARSGAHHSCFLSATDSGRFLAGGR
jgi:transposase-like protein